MLASPTVYKKGIVMESTPRISIRCFLNEMEPFFQYPKSIDNVESIRLSFVQNATKMARCLSLLGPITFQAKKESFTPENFKNILSALSQFAEEQNRIKILIDKKEDDYLFPGDRETEIDNHKTELSGFEKNLHKTLNAAGIKLSVEK